MSIETMTKLATVTVGSGGASSIDFTNIPATYTDLVVKFSGRATTTDSSDPYDLILTLNTTSTITSKVLRGDGSTAASNSITDRVLRTGAVPSNWTSNTFSNVEIYIPNYASSNNKSWSVDGVQENNATLTGMAIAAGLTSITAAITTVKLAANASNLAQYSTATLYGIRNMRQAAGNSVKATGGAISFDGTYVVHTFNSSGTFTPTASLTGVDYLVVAGGGSGAWGGGGGGAGGLRCTVEGTGGGAAALPKISLLPNASYTVTIGAGGASTPSSASSPRNGSNGTSTTFVGNGISISTVGGGGGGGADSGNGQLGGSGGGSNDNATSVGAGTTNEGYAGGLGAARGPASQYYVYAGGGGGAGGVGLPGVSGVSGGNGGPGFTTVIGGYSATYAGGGGSGTSNASATPGTGGVGGGGNGTASYNTTVNAFPGSPNTGGGGGGSGGGSGVSGAGGSGVVIIRYKA